MSQWGRKLRASGNGNGRGVLGTKDRNEDDRPALGATAVRLYKNDMLWRGAVDLIAVGSLIMLLTGGFSDIFEGIDKFSSSSASPSASQPQIPMVAVSPPVSQQTAANFTQVLNSPQNSQPVASAMPQPKKSGFHVFKDWIGTVSDEDRKILASAADLIDTDNQRAMDLLKAKAEAGEPNFQYLMGMAYGREVNRLNRGDNKIVADWLRRSAFRGHPNAQFFLGQMYRYGAPGFPIDYGEAVNWYEMAKANPQDKTGEGESELAVLYFNGIYLPRDTDKALENLKLSAAKGNPAALRNLGLYYLNKGDSLKAKEWMQKAAEGGNGGSQHMLATMYFDGKIDGQPDYTQFLKWEGWAADQGLIDAMLNLGDFYRYGKPGFGVDNKAAAKYYRMAALKKDPKGQALFAEMYEQGVGVPKDNIQAYVYYSLSYKSGSYPPAFSSLEALKAKMSPSELDYGQKMVNALITGE